MTLTHPQVHRPGRTAFVQLVVVMLVVLPGGCTRSVNAAQPAASPVDMTIPAGPPVPCVPVVTRLLGSELAEVASGLPGSAADTEVDLRNRYAANRAGLSQVIGIRDRLLLTAGDDLLNRYGRDVARELRGYQARIEQLCGAGVTPAAPR